MFLTINLDEQAYEIVLLITQLLFIIIFYLFPAIFLFIQNIVLKKKVKKELITLRVIHKRNLLFTSIYYGVTITLLIILIYPVMQLFLLGMFFFFPLVIFFICFIIQEIRLLYYHKEENIIKWEKIISKGTLYYYVLPIMALLGALSFNDCLTPLIFGVHKDVFVAFCVYLIQKIVAALNRI